MLIWRLSIARYAQVFDGGYGLHNEGRWNSRGHAITYAATSPALCLLEKLVHVDDPNLLPPLKMVCYDAPDSLACDETDMARLPDGWTRDAALTRKLGDIWLKSVAAPLMKVPSAVLPIADAAERNILVNHAHPDAGRIRLRSVEDFIFDARLL